MIRPPYALWLAPVIALSSCYGDDLQWDGDLEDPQLVNQSAEELFSLGATHYGVPRDLLVAIAWHESSFAPVHNDAENEHRPAHGWMGLSPERVELISERTGTPGVAIRERREPNILGAALAISILRDELAPTAPPSRVDASWWPVVVAWADAADPWMGHDFAWDLYRTLQVGLDAETPNGERLAVSARSLADLAYVAFINPPNALDSDGARDSAGYPARARYVAAESGNQGSRSGGVGAIDRIVIHTTEGSYNGAISWFQDPSSNVSAHYVIRRSDGEITQMVDDEDKAFHACQNNEDTIGIEHEGTAYSSSQWTTAQLDASARLSAWLVQRYDIPIDRDHIVGHGEIQPPGCAERDDPGRYFPWDNYLALIASYAGAETPTPSGDDDDPGTGAPVRWLSPLDGDPVTNPVSLRASHPGTHHVELWSGPLLLAEHRTEDPVSIEHDFPLGPRTLTIRGYAEWGSLLARQDISVDVVATVPGDDDDTTPPPGDDDDTEPACPADVCVDALPYTGTGTTTGGAQDWDSYACAPSIDESGPERLYRVTVTQAGTLHATVSDATGVDVDLHILSAPSPSACLDRGNLEASAPVTPGTWWVAADSWVSASGTVYDGPYTITIDLEDDSPGTWTPAPGTDWQWQLTGAIDTSFDVPVYDVDLWDTDQAVIDTLHAQGRSVICYFSAGSGEDWRPDYAQLAAADLGSALDGWPGERWLDIRSSGVRAVMEGRLALAASKGCDAVEPDNVDGYSNDSGFPLDAADQVDFNLFLATEAHARGLSVGLKNAVDLIPQLQPDFDWALNEECLAYGECGAYSAFLDAAKAVFHVEYTDDAGDGPARQEEVCADPARTGFSTLIKEPDLGPWRLTCADSSPGCTADICVPSLPWTDAGTTTGAASNWDSYSCAPSTDESGPEVTYAVSVPEDGLLHAEVSDGSGVDVDVHILSALDPATCLDRGNLEASAVVTAGTWYVVVDSWTDSSGNVYDGDYTLDLSFTPSSVGNCAMESDALQRIGTSVLLAMPASGPVVREAHLVTVDDGYGTSGSGPWPQSITENITNHYAVSEAVSGYAMARTEPWAPQEGSEFGQGAYYAKLPVLDEAWYITMYWANRPPGGTRMIVQANGLAVVAAAGYETGPGNLAHIAGVTEEIHDYLGTSHLDTMTVGFAVDQNLPLGPIVCE